MRLSTFVHSGCHRFCTLFFTILVLICPAPEARAWPPWQQRPVIFAAALSHSDEPKSNTDAADYVRTLSQAVAIPELGLSARDTCAKLLEGREVRGAEVIDVAPGSPAARAGIQPANMSAKTALLEFGSAFAIVVPPDDSAI
jgi:hypothetical protein